MKRKVISILCIGSLTAALLSGCGGNAKEPSKGDENTTKTDVQNSKDDGQDSNAGTNDSVIVTMPVTSEPKSGFDPAYGWGAGEHVHEPLIQSTLVTTTKDLKIEKDLATEYAVSEDKLTWTVKIRGDVKFTNGKALTAKDVAFTYNNCRDESSVNDFSMLKEAVAKDDTTVEFHLKKPYSIWPYTMAIVGIVPEEGYSKDYGQKPIGSGRYIMKQWDKGQQVIFEANPDYYGEAPKMKKLTILFVAEDASLAAAQAAKADVSYTAASYFDVKVDGYHLENYTSVDNRGLNLPVMPAETNEAGLTIGNNFTTDIKVRRAINIGINREEMIKNVLNGYGTPAYSVCDKMPWYNQESQVEYNQEEAVKLLEEGGWKAGADGIREKGGVRAAFTVLYPSGDSVRQALAEDVVNQMKALGIEVKTESVGWDIAYDRAQTDPLMWGWGAHTPMELYNIYHTNEKTGLADYSPYANEKVDQYMDEALASSDLEESYSLWQKAQWDGTTGITQKGDIPWVWLCNIDHLYFVKDGLKIADQKIHPHGHGWSIVNNVDQWSWE